MSRNLDIQVAFMGGFVVKSVSLDEMMFVELCLWRLARVLNRSFPLILRDLITHINTHPKTPEMHSLERSGCGLQGLNTRRFKEPNSFFFRTEWWCLELTDYSDFWKLPLPNLEALILGWLHIITSPAGIDKTTYIYSLGKYTVYIRGVHATFPKQTII